MTCCIMESSATTATQLSRRLNATVLVLDELFFAKVNRTKWKFTEFSLFAEYKSLPFFAKARNITKASRTAVYEPCVRVSVFMRYSEIIQVFLEGILRWETGVGQVSFFPIPLLQSAVIEHFYAVLNNKRHNIVFQAFLEHNQTTDTPVAVLERVNALKTHMERKDIFKLHCFLAVILIEQSFHFRRHFLGQGRFPSAFSYTTLSVVRYNRHFSRTAKSVILGQKITRFYQKL